jgi:hypothetical protein
LGLGTWSGHVVEVPEAKNIGTRFCGHVTARLKRVLSLCTLGEQDSFYVGRESMQAKTWSVQMWIGCDFALKLKVGRALLPV